MIGQFPKFEQKSGHISILVQIHDFYFLSEIYMWQKLLISGVLSDCLLATQGQHYYMPVWMQVSRITSLLD